MSHHQDFTIQALSENALVLYFGNLIREDIINRISNLNYSLKTAPFDGFIESVPAYVSLTVYYDPEAVLKSDQLKGDYAFEKVQNYLSDLHLAPLPQTTRKELLIPVCYGDEYGPDLADVAKHAGVTEEEVIKQHSNADYLVYMLGFMPGFPYLGGLPDALSMPRKNVPRAVVPAGSVGIAGKQTGIYPLNSPGGWQIIGRTPVILFDAAQSEPAVFLPGSRVKFSPITRADFKMLTN
ncbi:MAG: 5-oxoprolinase subunit PxpB [Sphingobacteriales bacterium]|nr:MAG: 5-oxoprolinase subunit PxpB [Sphingobacteriales bacterium]